MARRTTRHPSDGTTAFAEESGRTSQESSYGVFDSLFHLCVIFFLFFFARQRAWMTCHLSIKIVTLPSRPTHLARPAKRWELEHPATPTWWKPRPEPRHMQNGFPLETPRLLHASPHLLRFSPSFGPGQLGDARLSVSRPMSTHLERQNRAGSRLLVRPPPR